LKIHGSIPIANPFLAISAIPLSRMSKKYRFYRPGPYLRESLYRHNFFCYFFLYPYISDQRQRRSRLQAGAFPTPPAMPPVADYEICFINQTDRSECGVDAAA